MVHLNLHARNAPVVNQHFRWTPLWKQPQPPPAWSVHTGAPRCARMALVHMHGLFVCLYRGGSAAPVGGRRDSLPRHLTDWVSLWSWVHAPCSASGHCPHRRSLTAALKTMPWLKRLLCHRPDARASRYSPPLSPCSRFYSLLCATVQLSAPLVLAVVTDPPIVMRLIGSCTVARVAVAHSPRVRRRSGTATPATTAVTMSVKPFPLLASRQMAVCTVDRAAR